MPTQPTELETYFLELINEARAAEGAKPLAFDSELLDAAHTHSAWMNSTDTLSHTGANGSTPQDRIAAAGYDATRTGENIYYSWGTDETGATAGATTHYVEKSHNSFLNSPGHHMNLVDPNFEHIGISVKEGDYQGHPAVFVTEDFGTPTVAERAET